MEPNLTPTQHHFLKQLANAGSIVMLKDLKPKPKATPADRMRLVVDGLVDTGKQKRAVTFAVTEKGRAWIAAHPEVQILFPSPRQHLFLLRLAFMPSDGQPAGVASLLKPAERSPLITEKWVEEQKQKRTTQFTLTDAGWQWVEDHLGDYTSAKGLAESVVSDALKRVHTYLKVNGLRLADLIRAKQSSAMAAEHHSPPPANPDGDIKAAVRAACLRLGDGQKAQRIRLAVLRRELDGWDQSAIDHALLDLSLSRQLVLEAMDDPQEIKQEDRDAVFRTPSGELRHLAYWTQN